ncbi:MAG: MATE family efflux transporter [Bacteroidetes bacterium]|nr:MAG: MATE family efflux transporter [Bacteroidota bacterium]
MTFNSIRKQMRSVYQTIKLSFSDTQHDFTTMDIRKAIVLLAIPMVLELSMESVFALVDIFFVNRWLGNHAVTAVGLTESVITIVYSLAIGISMAATAMVARRVGEKNISGAREAAMQSILLALAIALVLSIAGTWYAPDILRLMAADETTINIGTGYTRIMMGSSGVIMLLFLINGIFRGAGNAAIAMKSLWIANLANIILDPLFIRWLGLDGAAIATCIGRALGVAYQLYHLQKGTGQIKLVMSHITWNVPVMKTLAGIAAPGTLQFIIASGSWIVLARLVAETGQADASAGYQTAIRVLIFFILPAWGLSNAAATLVGQHLGAQQPQLAEKAVQITTRYNIWFMAFVTAIFVSGAPWIIRFFTQNSAAIHHATTALRIISLGYIFYGIGMVMTNTLNGAGDTRTPTIINFFGFWLFQVPFAWWLAKGIALGPTGVFIAIPIAETLIALAAWMVFRRGKWKLVKV